MESILGNPFKDDVPITGGGLISRGSFMQCFYY